MASWDEIGDRVFRHRYAALRLNVGVVLGAEGALVVDTRGSPAQARELLHDLRELTALPVRRVVNTHYHWDHTWGNSEFPATPIWGHVECREEMLRQDADAVRRIAGHFPEMREELEGLRVVPPDMVFADTAIVDLGGRAVELRYPGRGHTNSDIAIVVQDAGVCFAGDLVEEGAPPYFEDSFPLEWPRAVRVLLEMPAGVFVPGHGGLMDRAAVAAQLLDLESLADLARDCVAGRMAVAEAARRGPFPEQSMLAALARAGAAP